MNVYGLRIGDIGIEYPSRADRDKAMLAFTAGSAVKIASSGGQRYSQGKGEFSVYDRDTSQQISNCDVCNGQFLAESCPKRHVPEKNWDGKFTGQERDMFICDGCLAARLQEKKLADAKDTVAAAQAK